MILRERRDAVEGAGQRTRRFEKLNTPTLANQVAEELVRGIAAGRIRRGDRLIEAELAADFGISRIPLREALGVLESEGILVAEARRGRRVAGYDDAQVHDITLTRLALERFAVQEAARNYRANPALLRPLDAVLEDMRNTVRGPPDPLRLNQNDVNFHTEIYAATGNSYLQMIWETLSRHVVIIFALETFCRLEPSANLAQHEYLRELLVTGSSEALDREIEAHILSYAASRGWAPPASQ